MKNLKTKLFALAMAAPMAMSSVSVFAAPATGEQQGTSVPKIKNEFTMPEGTAVPNVTFTYTVAKAEGDTASQAYPELTQPTITYPAEGETPTYTQTTPLFDESKFESAGVYTFTVTQNDVTAPKIDGYETVLHANTENASYTVRVYVTNKTEAEGGGFDFKYTVEGKDGKLNTTEDGNLVLTFKNDFYKTKVDETNGVFTLSQLVTGDMGDKNRDFAYTAILTAPENAGENPFAGTIGDTNVTAAGPTNFTMKGDTTDSVKLTKAPVGSTITISVSNASDHTTKYYEKDATAPTENNKEYTYVMTEDGLHLIVEQNKEGTTPTGNFINNMPFIALIAVALGGFVAYIAAKRRNA